MTAWGITMMRDEADVAYHTILHMASERLTGIIVADNGSTDGTRDQLERAAVDATCTYGTTVVIVDDDEVGYYQSVKMTELARHAAELGATWIVPFDADEIWYAKAGPLGVVLGQLPERWGIAHAPLYNHWTTGRDLPRDIVAFQAMTWHEPMPGALPKVAFRWNPNAVVNQGNHSVAGVDGRVLEGAIELRHFPYRSAEQFVRKAINGAAAYAATDLPDSQGAHWRMYGAIIAEHGEQAFIDEVYLRHFHFDRPDVVGMIDDPAPFRRWTSEA